MALYKFAVNGPLYGYRKSTIPVTTRKIVMKYGQPQAQVIRVNAREYTRFKQSVLGLAMEQGFRVWTPDRVRPARLSVTPVWGGSPLIDWKNVYGAVEDALFEQDRYVIPRDGSTVAWDTGEADHAIVTVEG